MSYKTYKSRDNRDRHAEGAIPFTGDQPPAAGPSAVYPGASDPGVTNMIPDDIRKPRGVPNPNDPAETAMTTGHPAFGRGTGNP